MIIGYFRSASDPYRMALDAEIMIYDLDGLAARNTFFMAPAAVFPCQGMRLGRGRNRYFRGCGVAEFASVWTAKSLFMTEHAILMYRSLKSGLVHVLRLERILMTILAGTYFIPAVMVAFLTTHLIAHNFMKIACRAGTYCKIFSFI